MCADLDLMSVMIKPFDWLGAAAASLLILRSLPVA